MAALDWTGRAPLCRKPQDPARYAATRFRLVGGKPKAAWAGRGRLEVRFGVAVRGHGESPARDVVHKLAAGLLWAMKGGGVWADDVYLDAVSMDVE